MRTWAPVAPSRHRILARRGPLLPSPARVSDLPSVLVLAASFRTLVLASPHPPPRYPEPSPADREDIDTIIEEVARDAVAEAAKIAAEEADKGAVEEADKTAAGERMVDNQPSSSIASSSGKYLKVGDNLFILLPGTASTGAPNEGEVFNDEVLTAAGLEVIDEPSVGGDGS